MMKFRFKQGDEMSVPLYDHQKKAIGKLRNGSVLCGDVGSGKSRTALAYYVTKIRGGVHPNNHTAYISGDPIPLYIITTARKRDTYEWDQECALFGLKAGEYIVDSWNNIKNYVEVNGAFFIFDEQRLVGYGAWARAFLKIAKANRWILLSATPGDTWMDYCVLFIANGYYRNKTDFVSQHVVYHRYAKFPKIVKYINTRKLERLRDDTVVTMAYSREASLHDEIVKVGYDEDLTKRSLETRFNLYSNEPFRNASELCYFLRKVVNSDKRRLVAVDHIVKNHPKCIVFYNFDYELDLLREYCDKTGTMYSEWNGHKHEPLPSGNVWLYLVQYTAGCEGWNCIETDTIIFFSQNYSYRVMHQAAGRINRMNSPYFDLYYYHLLSDSPIDKAIRAAVRKKKTFNEKIFSDNV